MLGYCAKLEQNNDRAWFHANHDEYVQAREDFIELTDRMRFAVAEETGPELAERLLFVDPKDLLFRIPRDMRVWKNAPPYNPSWRCYLAADRKAVLPVGYFCMIAPGDRSHFGTGGWCSDRDFLRSVRQFISDHVEEFEDALEQGGYPLSETEGKLKRVPLGFDPDDPAGEYLKYKEWYVSERFADAELTDADSFLDRVRQAVRRMEPLRRFFDRAFSQKPRKPWEGAWDETP